MEETPGWILTQHKAFARWINSQLRIRNINGIENLQTDLSDGVKLIQLLEIIGNESLGRFASNPKLRVQKAENVNLALEFIKHRNVQLYNIGAEDIIDGNLKLILGMIWTLILRFTIEKISEEGMSAREGLLLWCQRKTALYDDVNITDFSTSWNNGLAFAALLDRHRPDLIDYDSLDKSNHKQIIELVFNIMEKDVGIPRILDVEDICDVPRPDERSILTYLAHWFHTFSELDKIETAGRRVEKFFENISSSYSMKTNYEERMKILIQDIKKQIQSWNSSIFTGDYSDAKEQSNSFINFKNHQKRIWIAEKSELSALLGNIKIKISTYGLKQYNPPIGLRPIDLENEWSNLSKQEVIRSKHINAQIRKVKEELRKSFANLANDLSLSINMIQLHISELSGELEDQLIQITTMSDDLQSLRENLNNLKILSEQCEDANIEENDYTVHTYEDLEYEFELAKESVVKKLSFIENQIVARNMTNLTPIQLEEFESVFRYFDKSQKNCLQEHDFAAALASLGLIYSEAEMHDIFEVTSESSDSISFEQFIHFMVAVTEDQQSAEQVLKSFMDVADGKPYITELDLEHSLVPRNVIENLLDNMPVVESEEAANGKITKEGEKSDDELSLDGELEDRKKKRIIKYDYVAYMETLLGEETDGNENDA